MSAIGITREEGESWRDCAIRYAARYGLEDEIKSDFDKFKTLGWDDGDAALGACMEWDVCEVDWVSTDTVPTKSGQ